MTSPHTTTSQHKYSADLAYDHLCGKMPMYLLWHPLNSVIHLLPSHSNQMEKDSKPQFLSIFFQPLSTYYRKELQAFLKPLWHWHWLHSELSNGQGWEKNNNWTFFFSKKDLKKKKLEKYPCETIFQQNYWKYKKSVDVSSYLLSFTILFSSGEKKRKKRGWETLKGKEKKWEQKIHCCYF